MAFVTPCDKAAGAAPSENVKIPFEFPQFVKRLWRFTPAIASPIG